MTEEPTFPSPSVAVPPEPKQTRKRFLAPSEDLAEDLVAHIKKCRVSSTPGELRLKRDLGEGDLLCQQGIARFDRTAGSPLECQLTFLCPIGGAEGVQGQPAATTAGGARRRVPTTFSVVVPKFYPHDPPLLYAERCFSLTCPFVRDDGLLQLPFLSPGAWSSISTMSFVAQTLLEGLRKFADGHPHPWGQDKAVPSYAGDRGKISRGIGDVGATIAAGQAVVVCDAGLSKEDYRGVVQAVTGSTARGSSDCRSKSTSRSSGECAAAVGRRPHQQHGGDSFGGGGCPSGMDVADSL